MDLFGDESGHLRSLLQGNCDLFVVALVAGEPIRCTACAKKAVRAVNDIEEAKWNELTDVQKRRLIDCLTDPNSDLSFGYVAITSSDLNELSQSYRLYEDDFQYSWDLCVLGDSYAELANQLISDDRPCTLTFDRVHCKKQSNRVKEVVVETVPEWTVKHSDSRKVGGIQTADCFAGAVREHLLGTETWLDSFDSNNVIRGTDYALAAIERRLYEDNTGP